MERSVIYTGHAYMRTDMHTCMRLFMWGGRRDKQRREGDFFADTLARLRQ